MSANDFTNEFEHTIDTKSRMFLPAKYREFVGASVILRMWDEGCLYLMTKEGWEAYIEKVHEILPETDNRNVYRRLFGTAADAPLDSQGRILIPQKFMEHAGLKDKAIIVGCGAKAEIWAPDRWNALNENYDADEMIRVLSANGL